MKRLCVVMVMCSMLMVVFTAVGLCADERPYQFTPVPIVSDGVSIHYAGRHMVSYYQVLDPEERPVKLEYEADRYEIAFQPPKNPMRGMQLVDLVPDTTSYNQPAEETKVSLETDLIVFDDAPDKNATVVIRAKSVVTNSTYSGDVNEETMYWSGQSYTVTLDMEENTITVREYYDSELVHEWEEEYDLRVNTGYSVRITNLYDELDTALKVIEKSVDEAGKPVHKSIYVKLSTLGFGPLDGSILPNLFSVGARKSHTVFWNTTLSQK